MDMEATKVCTGCGFDKPLTHYHRRAASKDGRMPKCKDCASAIDKARANLPHRVAARKAYQQTETYKEKHDTIQTEWRQRHREKVRAHSRVAYALRTGKLIRPLECEGCGPRYTGKLEAHHDDYSKPLDVKWLCDTCHKARHVELRMEATPHQDQKWNINADMGFHSTLPHEETTITEPPF